MPHGKRRVSVRQGWAGEKGDFFSILLRTCAKDQRQELEQRGDKRARHVGVPALGSFAIDDDGDPIHSRCDRLTRSLQISTLWHGLAGLRQTGHNHHRSRAGKFSGRHRAGRVIELERKG